VQAELCLAGDRLAEIHDCVRTSRLVGAVACIVWSLAYPLIADSQCISSRKRAERFRAHFVR
jgi:hypothetical protein